MNQFPIRSFSLFLVALLIVCFPSEADAQRGVTYEDLRQRSELPNIYTNYLTLPSSENNAIFLASFRMDYDLLPFRRVRADMDAPEDFEFFSTARMNMEIIRGSASRRQQSGLESVTRNSWADTAYARSFEDTQSRFLHIEGATHAALDEGEYSVILDLNRDESERRARSRDKTFQVPDFGSHEKGVIALLESAEQDGDVHTIKLLNYGEYALYGQDYQLLVLFPADADDEIFNLKIERLRTGSDNRLTGDILYTQEISESDLLRTPGFKYPENTKKPLLTFSTSEEGHNIALLDIPASKFANVQYRISLEGPENDEPLASLDVNSRWIDMPVSLLNLNIAIDMLRFIVDDNQLREMRRGSAQEREQKFREFWSQRDPNPETEFNELMAEYYSRIDYAYDNFTSPERPGYESDKGRAYILYGEPRNRDRTFPTGRPTREVWEYRDRVLVFEATSGFGDFRLVEERTQ